MENKPIDWDEMDAIVKQLLAEQKPDPRAFMLLLRAVAFKALVEAGVRNDTHS